jgi:hypothetical protein
MNKIKNSFALGLLIGLATSFVLLVIVDAAIYFILQSSGRKILDMDARFAICIVVSLLLGRKFFKNPQQQELGKGFLFSAFLWGAGYVYLFHIRHTPALFFAS